MQCCDFFLHKREDALLEVPLTPITAIGGWSIETRFSRNFGSTSGWIVKSMASGFYGVSGMNISNSGVGIFYFEINSLDTSGLTAGNYAYTTVRTDSGFRTDLAQGYLNLQE